MSSEFLTSFAVGGFAGLRRLGEATLATAAFLAGVVVITAKDVLARNKTMRVSGCILKVFEQKSCVMNSFIKYITYELVLKFCSNQAG